jgi:hypothetical protein
MVDRDKIRDRMSGSDKDKSESSDSGSNSKSKRSRKKSTSKDSKSTTSSKDVSSSNKQVDKNWERGDVPRSHIKKVLMAIANSILYAEGKSRAVEDPSNAREEYSKAAADNMYEQYSDIVSQYEVQLIAEKYGFDWADDIVKEVLEDQDYANQVGV